MGLFCTRFYSGTNADERRNPPITLYNLELVTLFDGFFMP